MQVSHLTYGSEVVARLVALCEADAAREVCGFITRHGDALHVAPITNVADRYHALDAARFPRTSREAYLMDPKEQVRVHRELESTGGEIAAVWHSHVEVGAYFSEKDRADALVEGEQVIPGAEYLVLGVRGGRVTEMRRYRFDGGAFVESDLA